MEIIYQAWLAIESNVSGKNENNCNSSSSAPKKPYKGYDPIWELIQVVRVRDLFLTFESYGNNKKNHHCMITIYNKRIQS